MSKLKSFGSYTFENNQTSIVTNFSNLVPRTDRLPGLAGGFDQFGDDELPSEIGRVTARMILTARTAAEMEYKRDQVRQMTGYGRESLTMITGDGLERFCYAKINNISMPDGVVAPADTVQEVVIDWQVTAPRWYSANAASPKTQACSGASTTFTLTNGGTAPALVGISINPGTAISSSGLSIQRLVSAVVKDQVAYAAALLDTDVLSIDARNLTVRKNGSDAYANAFTANHPAWLRLLPGNNSIKVILSGGESADVTFTWYDTWY